MSTAVSGAEHQSFADEVTLEIRDGVALLTLAGADGAFPWGTLRAEHRWNPATVTALGQALDAVEASDEVCAVVVTNVGKFWSNGMDLKYLDASSKAEVREIGDRTNDLMARICCFPLPTVAAIQGHFCAAGGMMGLCFDYRVMSTDRGFFFIPGVDLGLVYSPLQMAVMSTKLPQSMHRDVILLNTKRWSADELAATGAVDVAVPCADVLPRAMELAAKLKAKGQGPARKALGGIKRGLYKNVLDALAAGGEMDTAGRTRGIDRAAPVPTSKL